MREQLASVHIFENHVDIGIVLERIKRVKYQDERLDELNE